MIPLLCWEVSSLYSIFTFLVFAVHLSIIGASRYRGLSHHLYLQALCYFPAAFARFIIVEVTDTLGFSGHLTIKAVRVLVKYIQRMRDIFPLVKSVCRGQVILGEAFG